jgi:hypothetical protein
MEPRFDKLQRPSGLDKSGATAAPIPADLARRADEAIDRLHNATNPREHAAAKRDAEAVQGELAKFAGDAAATAIFKTQRAGKPYGTAFAKDVTQ